MNREPHSKNRLNDDLDIPDCHRTLIALYNLITPAKPRRYAFGPWHYTSTKRTNFYFIILSMFLMMSCSIGSIVPNKMSFAGKVVNSVSGEWPNNRLVLVFLNGKEVARSVSSLSQFPASTDQYLQSAIEASLGRDGPGSDGLNDGVFKADMDNTYGLTADALEEEGLSRLLYFSRTGDDIALAVWLGEIEEGAFLRIPIEQKNSEYAIKVVEGDLSTLPQELLISGSTLLQDDGTIVVSLQDAPNGSSSLNSDNNIDVNSVDYATSTEKIELNKITVPINNCGGSTRVSQTYSQSQTYIREYQVSAEASLGVEIPLSLWLRLIPELSLQYGFQQGQIDTKIVEYDMAAEAGTSLVYTISWQEIWESGQAEVISGDDLIIVPFRVKSDMIYALNSQSIPCD